MKKNLIPIDRAVRAGAGLFLLATPILDLPTYPYNLLGVVLMTTALFGFCPLYASVGLLLPRSRPAAGGGAGGLARAGTR